MSLFNSNILIGRIFNEPVIKVVKGKFGDLRNCSLTLTNVEINPRTGAKDYMYIECTLWNEQADKAVKTLHKGSVIVVEGKLRQDRWEDATTKAKRSKHVIEVRTWQPLDEIMTTLPSIPKEISEPKPQPKQYTSSTAPSSFSDGPPLQEPPQEYSGDELPF